MGNAQRLRTPDEVLLEDLSPEAQGVVSSSSHRLLVVAGAGAGKTEAMARRIAWWYAVEGVPKDKIVAFTFTERAAEEMKFRIRRYMALVSPDGEDPSLGGMYVGTIHSYCMNTLRQLWPAEYHNDEIVDDVARYALVQQGYDYVLGLTRLATVLGSGRPYPYSRADTIEYFLRGYDLLNEYNRLHVDLSDERRPAFGRESEWCKQAALVEPVGDDEIGHAFSVSAARYYAYLRCRHFLDFSTSQSELVRRLQSDDDVLAALRETTTHVVVDEVQDVNVVQDALRRALMGTAGHLTAVGDHRQAIYGWRGGRIDLMADLAAELQSDPDGDVLELTTNYRSTPRIVAVSNLWNKTITTPPAMTSPDMRSGRASRVDADASHVAHVEFQSRADEAQWVAAVIETLVQGNRGAAHDTRTGDRGIMYSDIAVLVRSSTDARTYQKALQNVGVPAVVRAGPDLFAQPEVLLFAAALSLSAQRDSFMGSQWNQRSLPRRIQDELNVAPEAEAVIRSAYSRLYDEGLTIAEDAPDRLITAAESIASRIYGSEIDRRVTAAFRTPELREFVAGRAEVRRVFPQSLLQMLMAEGGIAGWDEDEPRARMAMFHLGQLSSLVTGIETPGWTSPSAYKHQVTSLLLWASKQASPEEAPLLVAPDAVTVSTIHSCKGLEFAVVFVADVVSRRFPSQLARRADPLPFGTTLAAELRTDLLGDNVNLDSERRLMYVAMTRAERYLFITSSKPSPFFSELHGLFAAAGGRLDQQPATLPAVQLREADESRETRLVTSFSDLRYFLECPHDFYLRKVLGFTPTIDQAFGYGRGVHNLLREVHLDPASWAADAENREALEKRLRHLIEIGLFYLRHTTGDPARLMQAKGVQVVADYVATYRSELAELTFEPEREFEVLLPEQNVLVTGAIDLVRRDDPPRVTIIDFKSGEAESDKHQALDDDEMRLQVSLYAIAAKQELQYEPEQGLVRYLGELDEAQRELVVPLTPGAVQASREQVQSLAQDIQERRFRQGPATRHARKPKDRCDGCDYRRLCALSLA